MLCWNDESQRETVFNLFQEKIVFWTKDDKYRLKVYTGITGRDIREEPK
jgi:hypothetical protein